MKAPTAKQREALAELARERQGSWRYASTTVHVLVERQWANRIRETSTYGGRASSATYLEITDLGREMLR